MATDRLHREIGKRIDQACKRKGWSHNRLADFAGVSRGSLSTIVNGASSPTIRSLKRIATALDVKVRDLLPPEE